MKKFFKFFALCLIGALFIGTLVFLYFNSKPKEEVYDTYKVEVRDLKKTTVVTGDIEPRDEVSIKPRISGIISELLKQPGEMVKAGDVIAKIKVVPDMQSLSSTENQVRLAQIDLNQAKIDLEREQKLFDDKLVSADEYDKYRKAYLQAKVQLNNAIDNREIAKNGVSKSQAKMSNTLVKSTLNGLILEIPVKVGSSVIMSNNFNDGTTIATVANMSNLIFKGYIDETEVASLHTGMPMDITVGALQGQVFNARLEFIAPKVKSGENAANQYEIKAAVNVPVGITIRSGYGANGNIVLQSASHVPTLPEGAINYEKTKAYVYVMTKSKPQTFEKRFITTGLSDGVYIEITSGLKAGEVVRGNLRVADDNNKDNNNN